MNNVEYSRNIRKVQKPQFSISQIVIYYGKILPYIRLVIKLITKKIVKHTKNTFLIPQMINNNKKNNIILSKNNTHTNNKNEIK